jgi:predicted phage replisome organizer/uncharacterized phage protein (TIGR02220 family)
MGEVKWIKIVTDIFNNKKIRIIESMPEGDAIIVIWFKLLMLAGNINEGGNVFFTRDIPYTDQMLSTLFNRPVTTVQLALKTFVEFNMIDIFDDIIHVSNWEKYQNVEGMEKIREQTRARVAKHRENKRLQCNVTCNATVTDSNAIDIDKDIDKEKDINILSSKVEDVVSYLNQKTGKSFRASTKGTQKHIKARLDEGYSVEDFYSVIDVKCSQWLEDSKMSAYLRPETLFAPGHFEAYLNEAPKKAKIKQPEVVIDPEEEARQKAWEEGFHDA